MVTDWSCLTTVQKKYFHLWENVGNEVGKRYLELPKLFLVPETRPSFVAIFEELETIAKNSSNVTINVPLSSNISAEVIYNNTEKIDEKTPENKEKKPILNDNNDIELQIYN